MTLFPYTTLSDLQYYITEPFRVVLVKKGPGKWRMCNDFTGLNKYCPKDPYPLPRIDQLVDSTAGCELLSFMDAFQGFYQIRMAPEDVGKTAFVTKEGVYCFRVMPFGLRNAGATYQRLVNRMFQEEIGKTMEVYIDDMLIKSEREEDHIEHMKKCFGILRKFGMKLNPTKCTFGVRGGKFLGYMVTERGIEANPEKIKAILDLEHPKNRGEAQSLIGKIISLNRFIAKSAERSLPFFKTLRKNKKFEWTEACGNAFEELKKYLQNPPLLAKPIAGEALYVYLAISEEAVSSVLVRVRGDEYLPVYYLSKALLPAEINYSQIEKFALSLISTARKLKPYFQAHEIIVITSQPLKRVFNKPETSGRIARWALELSEHKVEFQAPTSKQAQVIADFLVLCPRTDDAVDRKSTRLNSSHAQ